MPSIAARLHELEKAIATCQTRSQPPTLVAVSKGQSLHSIKEAFSAGIKNFAENYWQEAFAKIHALSAYPLTWHFIGAIQSNKAALIAQHVDWVHSLDREKIARALSLARPQSLSPLNLCIQVNIDADSGKGGLLLSKEGKKALIDLALLTQSLPGLRLRGLMTILREERDPQKQKASFLKLANLLQELNQEQGLHLDTLSMGMSEDWPMALAAGSTLLRIGRGIFGQRQG